MKSLHTYINEAKNNEIVSKIRYIFFDRSKKNQYFDDINLKSGVLEVTLEKSSDDYRFFPWFDMVKLRNEYGVKKLIIRAEQRIRIDVDNGIIEDMEIQYHNDKNFGILELHGIKTINKATFKGKILTSLYGSLSPQADRSYKIDFDYEAGKCKNPKELEVLNKVFVDTKKVQFLDGAAFYANIQVGGYPINISKDFGYNVTKEQAKKLDVILNQLPKDIPLAPDAEIPENSYIVGGKMKEAPVGFSKVPEERGYKNVFVS